jgi:hypothetical protein
VTLLVGDRFEKKLPYARPSEMIWVKVPGDVLKEAHESILVRCEEN